MVRPVSSHQWVAVGFCKITAIRADGYKIMIRQHYNGHYDKNSLF